MEKITSKEVTVLMLILLLTSKLSMAFIASVKAQDSVDSYTVGLWHLDEILPDGYREITPDATGTNPGTLVTAPTAPVLVEGKFDKAMEFDGNNGVYVPIRFLVGFPPSPQPIYIPISTSLDIPKEIKIEAWINVQGFKNVNYARAKLNNTKPQDLLLKQFWIHAPVGCHAGILYFSLRPNGDVYPCTFLPVNAGNIREQSLTDIWRNSKVLNELRERSLLKGKCGECAYRETCGRCRGRAHACSGDYLETDPVCLQDLLLEERVFPSTIKRFGWCVG